MAEGMAVASANSSLDTVLAGTTWVQLHTAAPGAAGTTAIAGNSTRKSITMAAAASGDKASNSAAAWTTVSNTETYTHFSLWTASSAGTFLYSGTVSGGAVTAGNDFTIASGSLTCSITEAA